MKITPALSQDRPGGACDSPGDAPVRPERTSRLRRLANVGAVALVPIVLVGVPWLPSMCPTRLLFHVPCPSCGLTRAARCLLHGDLAGATQMHPLWWLVFPALVVLGTLEAVSYVRTGVAGQWTERRVVQRVGAVVIVALLVVWAARGLGAFGGPVAIE